jgi:predicted lipoprotein with Yx(FWY)xxD motif
MRFRPALLAILVALSASLLLAAWAEDDSSSAAGSPAEVAKKKKKKGARLTLKDSEYGKAVMNARGRVLYLFTKETTPEAQCYGDCAVAWPPFLTKGKPVAGEGLDQKLVGTTVRSDGRRQVTYGGHPLYYYEHDRPGVILCQDVFEFGGDWLIVNRRGNAIR